MKTYYFFYSAKQRTAQNNFHRTIPFAKLNNGEIIEYTEMGEGNKPYGKWDDFIFLGMGNFHHEEINPYYKKGYVL